MGVDYYIITGRVIGKDRISEYDPWNPKVKVESWRPVNFLKDLAVKVLFFIEIIVLLIILGRVKKTLPKTVGFNLFKLLTSEDIKIICPTVVFPIAIDAVQLCQCIC